METNSEAMDHHPRVRHPACLTTYVQMGVES